MWFDQDENESSAGYADMLTDVGFAAIVVVIASAASFVWIIYKNGGLPPWL